MPWFVVDDNAHSHPKMIAAGNAALGLWLRCGTYAAQHLTDGIVPGVIAKMYGSRPQIARLVAAGLWHEHGHTCRRPKCAQPAPGDFYIHDYLAPYNPSRDEVERKRERAAEKKRKQRSTQDSDANRDGFFDESRANRNRFEGESSTNHTPKNEDSAGHDASSPGDNTGTRARAFPSPPLPSNYYDVAEEGGETTGSTPVDLDRLAPTPIELASFTVTDGMRRWAHRDGYAALIDIDHSTAQFVSHYRATGAHRKSWPDAWQKWIRDDAKRATERADRPTSNVVPFTQPRPSTTDARVQAALDLGRQMQAEYDAAQAATHQEAQ
jgi:hypothetical protein